MPEAGCAITEVLSTAPPPLMLASDWPAPPTSTTSLPGTTERPSSPMSRVKRVRWE